MICCFWEPDLAIHCVQGQHCCLRCSKAAPKRGAAAVLPLRCLVLLAAIGAAAVATVTAAAAAAPPAAPIVAQTDRIHHQQAGQAQQSGDVSRRQPQLAVPVKGEAGEAGGSAEIWRQARQVIPREVQAAEICQGRCERQTPL